jgi:hypothetical protein
MARWSKTPAPPTQPSFLEALQELLDYYVGLDLWVFASIIVLASLVGRYGFTAVLMAPVTFAVWLFQSIRSFRVRPFIIVWGTTEDAFTDKTADKVVHKANAEARQQYEQAHADNAGAPLLPGDAGMPEAAGGPPNASQRAPLRNRQARAQQVPADGSI